MDSLRLHISHHFEVYGILFISLGIWFSFILLRMEFSPPQIIIHRLPTSYLICGGMECPICLVAIVRQMTFRGEIIEQRLKRVLKENDAFFVKATKLRLGKSFVAGGERYHLDSDISSMVVVALLDISTPKDEVKVLLQHLLKATFPVGLDEVLAMVERGGLLKPKDLHRANMPGVAIEYFPCILDIRGVELVADRSRAHRGRDFLKKMFNITSTEGFEWIGDFHDYLFKEGEL